MKLSSGSSLKLESLWECGWLCNEMCIPDDISTVHGKKKPFNIIS